MRINTIYNCIVLFYLHAFCLLLCFQIEDSYDVELQMGASFLTYNVNYWDLLLQIICLAPFILYYFFKKKDDTESNNFDKVFGLIFSIILLFIVIGQLTSCSKKILSFDLPILPGLLCIGVNILALTLYYLWIYSQQKFPNTEKVKIVRISTISCVLIQLIYCVIVTNTYAPFEKMRLLNNDHSLYWCINKIQSINNEKVNNIDYIFNKIFDKKHNQNIKKFIRDKHLIYEKIDDNKYKISWKTYLNKKEKDKINREKIWIDDFLYNENDKIIEIKKENKQDKKGIAGNNKKIKLNKEEAEAMKVLYNTLEKQNKQLLEQFDLENIQEIEVKTNKKPKLNLNKNELKAMGKFFDTLSDNNKESFQELLKQAEVYI